jgi:photosystem II stability/assembly factor-like uncharacterized protein
MKKFLLISACTLFVLQIYPQEWREAVAPTYNPLSDVFFLNENVGWMVGSSGEFRKSTDGGFTWEKPVNPLPFEHSNNCVQFLDETIGFIGTDSARILKTTDGSQSWTVHTMTDAVGEVQDVYFSDPSNGWALVSTSSQAKVLHTTDGGNTWTVGLSHTTGDLEAMDFYSANKGICVGGGLGKLDFYYTTDGITWSSGLAPTIPPGYTRTDARCVYMTSETIAYVSGWGSRAAGLQPSLQLKTTDGGATWIYQEQLEVNRTYVNLYGNYFKDELNGLTVGGGSYEGTVVVRTTDGGTNWLLINAPFGFSAKSIYGIGNKVWVVGGGGAILYSSDFGDTWQLISKIPISSLYSFSFFNGSSAVTGGYNGLFILTTDGGINWTAKYAAANNVCPNIQDIQFLDNNIGYAARNNRMVSKTTDGGDTWTAVLRDTFITSMTNYGVSFLDENYGFVVGKIATDLAAIYITTDGGVNWTEQDGGFISHLNDVTVHDQNNIAIIGNDLVAAYSTDGGGTWNNSTLNGVPGTLAASDLNHLYFMNATNGLSCGESILLKTTDGGVNWDYVEIAGLDEELKTSCMVNELHWFTVGNDYIFETTDGGVTWNDIADPAVITSSQLYGIDVDADGYPWVAATSSYIYTTSPVSGISNEYEALPDNFKLSQNYPNPFNPSTNIEFSIPQSGLVTLNIYDVLGRKVKDLLNEFKAAGNYTIHLNAANLTSGIYFYSLNVDGKTITNKMTLIK